MTDIAQLQVDGGNATFSSDVGSLGTPIPTVILMAGSGTTTFGSNFFASTVSASGGPGAISFNGTTTTVTNAATFSNLGTLSRKWLWRYHYFHCGTHRQHDCG
ncbi:MAG UNVERIFIED_CONTAM: hypothetical protein LVR18_34660 [Planctomycetaceae bacterium]